MLAITGHAKPAGWKPTV